MPSNRPLIKVGADPECWLRDPSTGQFISAHDKIPGTKLEPFKVVNGAIQVDGVAAEFNIEPAINWEEFINNNTSVIKQLQARIPNLELVYSPTAVFDPDYFKSLPDQARELGCNPDFNAWTGELNPTPNGSNTSMRTAAGHIHIGWLDNVDPGDPSHREDCHIVTKQMDYFLGMFSVLWDNSSERRTLYGKAGALRYKKYGSEYRVLSNVWLTNNNLMKYVYDNTIYGMKSITEDGYLAEEEFGNAAQVIINNSINWLDIDELLRYKDLFDPKVDLRRLSELNKVLEVSLPEIPKPKKVVVKTALKKNPKHHYQGINQLLSSSLDNNF